MFKRYSIFMMMLIGAGSLIGISSSLYQPTNVETQPQPQPQSPLIKGLVTQKQFESTAQAIADKQLLDRLFPQIIKRIDGKTLLQKIDAKTLAAKILPYLDLKVRVIERPGEIGRVEATGPLPSPVEVSKHAYCIPEETIIGAGFTVSSRNGIIKYSKQIRNPEGWAVGAEMDRGQLFTWANCLKVELALKQVEQPPQPSQQPSQPPGGPPLRPPSNP